MVGRSPRASGVMSSSRAAAISPGAAWLLGLILFVGSAYFYQDPEWNGNSRLDLTRAIVEQGTFQIDQFHEAPGWYTGDKALYGGHYYSDKAIGASFMAVPVYWVLFQLAGDAPMGADATLVKHILTTTVMGAMFTLAGLSMFSIALRITGGPWKAVLPTLALAFGTMLWPYSAVFYGHVPAAAFLVLAFALLMAADDTSAAAPPARWFWIGLAVSMSFLSDHTSSLVILGLAAYALYILRRLDFRQKLRRASPAIPGLLIPLLIFFFYNLTVYGKPVAFGYSYEAEERFQEIMGLGLMGMRIPSLGASYHIILDPKFGLLWLSPVLVLTPIGYFVALKNRRFRSEAAVSAYVIATVFLMNAASYLWYGGSAFGPRLMISALPFFIVPLALLSDGWRGPLAVLGTVSAANMLIPLLGQIQYTRLEFRPDRGGFFVGGAPFHGFSLLYQYGWTQVRQLAHAGHSPWTLGTAMRLPLWLSVVYLLGLESALLLAFRRLTSAPGPSPNVSKGA